MPGLELVIPPKKVAKKSQTNPLLVPLHCSKNLPTQLKIVAYRSVCHEIRVCLIASIITLGDSVSTGPVPHSGFL